MSCERYSEALIDAACGAPATDELTSHLEACAACRAAFEEQQQLLASIDGELREALDVTASRDFPARVMAQVGERRRRTFAAAWWQVAAAAAVIVLGVYAWPWSRNDRNDRTDREPAVAHMPPPGPQSTAIEMPAIATPQPRQPAQVRASVKTPTVEKRTTPSARPAELEVLIPESQTRALARIYQLARQGVVDPNAPPSPPIAAELEIAPIVIPELVIGDAQSGGGSQ